MLSARVLSQQNYILLVLTRTVSVEPVHPVYYIPFKLQYFQPKTHHQQTFRLPNVLLSFASNNLLQSSYLQIVHSVSFFSFIAMYPFQLRCSTNHRSPAVFLTPLPSCLVAFRSCLSLHSRASLLYRLLSFFFRYHRSTCEKKPLEHCTFGLDNYSQI